MRKIFNWWNSLKPENRRLFDVGVLCSPFHIGLGLTLYFHNPAIMLGFCVFSLVFVSLNWKYQK